MACHRFIPSGLSQSGHFSRPCPPPPPPPPVSSRQRRQTDVWLVIGVTVVHTHTHEKGALPLEGRPRHPVGKTGAAPENCTRPCVTEFCPRLLANWFLHWLCSTRGTRAFFPSPSIFFVRRNSLRDFFPWLRFEILFKRRGRRICWDAFREWIGTDCCENVFTAVCVEANGKIIVSEMLYFNFGSFRLGSRQNFIPFVIFHSEE